MKHILKEHVTNVMLEMQGFRLVFDKDIRAIKTLKNGSVFIEHNGEVLTWRQSDIQSLIDLGYVGEINE